MCKLLLDFASTAINYVSLSSCSLKKDNCKVTAS